MAQAAATIPGAGDAEMGKPRKVALITGITGQVERAGGPRRGRGPGAGAGGAPCALGAGGRGWAPGRPGGVRVRASLPLRPWPVPRSRRKREGANVQLH